MAEILLRFNSHLYSAGDTIFGAVYLRIDGPTSGYGIKVTISGLESYTFHNVKSLTRPCSCVDDRCVGSETVKVLDEQLILCLQKYPFAIGQYVLPFKQALPKHLPGSFEQRSWHGPKWEARLSYQVSAEVIGSEKTKTCVPFKVDEPFHCETGRAIEVNHRVPINKLFRSLKTDFAMSISLDKSGYNLGETVKITIQLNTTDTRIKHITIKLARSLQLVKLLNSSSDRNSCRLCHPTWGDDVNHGDESSSADLYWPEDGPKVVWSAFLSHDKAMQGSTVPTVFMLLSEDLQGFALQPSVHSTLIQCHYAIQLEVELEVGEKITAELPLPHVGHRKFTHMQWEEKKWMRSCTTIFPDDFGKGDHWTDWNVYVKSNFPTLFLMRSPSTRRRHAGKERSIPLNDVMSADVTHLQTKLSGLIGRPQSQ